MSNDSEHPLQQIERRAERAIVQELRILLDDVLALRPMLDFEDRAYADGLLMKLDKLIRDQILTEEVVKTLPIAYAA